MTLYLSLIIVAAYLAVSHRVSSIRLDRNIYGLYFIVIALFSGLRFRTGQDWGIYEDFFSDIDISKNPIGLYFSDDLARNQFEIGYCLLNYLIKFVGGTQSIVILIASLFCSFSVYQFTKRFNINRFYIVAGYFTHAYLLLHFAQVRQSIAVGFFLLGCDYYVRHKKKLPSIAIALCGVFFQYSSIMYVLLMVFVFSLPEKLNFRTVIGVLLVVISVLSILTLFTDYFSVLSYIANNVSAEEKIKVYQEMQTEQGSGQLIYSFYLGLLVSYFLYFAHSIPRERLFVVNYAIISLLLTIIFTIIFTGFYAIYSRMYVVASIFQAYACALIFTEKKGGLHDAVFIVTIIVAIISYGRMLFFYEHEYTPYQSILFMNF